MAKRSSNTDVSIRWIIRRDMPEVVKIEKNSFEFAWTEEDILACLRHKKCIGMVAERNKQVLGYMIYELEPGQLHLLNFAVAPWAREQGIGSQMVEELTKKLYQGRLIFPKNKLYLEVTEANLPAHLFFQKHGFEAVSILKNHFRITGENAYKMDFSIAKNRPVDTIQDLLCGLSGMDFVACLKNYETGLITPIKKGMRAPRGEPIYLRSIVPIRHPQLAAQKLDDLLGLHGEASCELATKTAEAGYCIVPYSNETKSVNIALGLEHDISNYFVDATPRSFSWITRATKAFTQGRTF